MAKAVAVAYRGARALGTTYLYRMCVSEFERMYEEKRASRKENKQSDKAAAMAEDLVVLIGKGKSAALRRLGPPVLVLLAVCNYLPENGWS